MEETAVDENRGDQAEELAIPQQLIGLRPKGDQGANIVHVEEVVEIVSSSHDDHQKIDQQVDRKDRVGDRGWSVDDGKDEALLILHLLLLHHGVDGERAAGDTVGKIDWGERSTLLTDSKWSW